MCVFIYVLLNCSLYGDIWIYLTPVLFAGSYENYIAQICLFYMRE